VSHRQNVHIYQLTGPSQGFVEADR
jgi:hypothetical protein